MMSASYSVWSLKLFSPSQISIWMRTNGNFRSRTEGDFSSFWGRRRGVFDSWVGPFKIGFIGEPPVELLWAGTKQHRSQRHLALRTRVVSAGLMHSFPNTAPSTPSKSWHCAPMRWGGHCPYSEPGRSCPRVAGMGPSWPEVAAPCDGRASTSSRRWEAGVLGGEEWVWDQTQRTKVTQASSLSTEQRKYPGAFISLWLLRTA